MRRFAEKPFFPAFEVERQRGPSAAAFLRSRAARLVRQKIPQRRQQERAKAATVLIGRPQTILLQNVERLPDGSVRMQLSGATNRSYAIDASSHLTNWTTLDTIFYTNGWMPFIDATTGGITNRFYRARLVP